MGPTIILDKSAFQSLSEDDTYELRWYFYVVVPPVLILEILADLKKPKLEQQDARASVRNLARKMQPLDGKVNVDYRTLCVADLLGGRIPMRRVPAIAGGHRVRAKDGAVGVFFDVQPENEALMRWSCDQFEEAEELLAVQWRHVSGAIQLDDFRQQLRTQVDWVPLNSMSLVRQVVDQVMVTPAAQLQLIRSLLLELGMIPEVSQWTVNRWRNRGFSSLTGFAAYAAHCARVSMVFQLALVHGLIGTRSTNRIDMEYFYYSPFAHIFCSGDKLHRKLAQQVLEPDQSFVWHEDLRSALRQIAEARKQAKESGRKDFQYVEPDTNSLIRTLWGKHIGRWPGQSQRSPMSKEEEEQLMNRLRPWTDACDNAKRKLPPAPKWPCP